LCDALKLLNSLNNLFNDFKVELLEIFLSRKVITISKSRFKALDVYYVCDIIKKNTVSISSH